MFKLFHRTLLKSTSTSKCTSNTGVYVFTTLTGYQKFCMIHTSVMQKQRKPETLLKNNIKTILDNYDTILLDCDGVLWSTDHYTKFENIGESIDKLRNLGKDLLFVTNNSMHARSAYKDKFQKYGDFDADVADIYAISYVAAAYLKKTLEDNEKCYLVGNKGMKTELENAGIEYIGYGEDPDKASDHVEDLLKQPIDNNVGAVLVGFDHHFCYNKLFKATSYLMDPSCDYVTTNSVEVVVKIGPKHNQPLTGAILAAIDASSKRSPKVLGKPHQYLFECIQHEKPNLNFKRAIMIGDSLYSDVHFANNIGIDSALVLTGASNLSHIETALQNQDLHLIPKFILPKFSDFNSYL